MHCPSCGVDTNLDQSFCRGCGMDLEAVGKLVAQHSSPESLKQEKSRAAKAVQQRVYRSFTWGFSTFIFGMATLFVLKTLAFDKTFNLIGGFFLFLGMAIMMYGALSGMRAGAAKSRKLPHPDQPVKLPKAETTKELSAARVPVPIASVTERTTQLLATEDRDKTGERS